MSDLELAGKRAVVTGSARGWGKGIAQELAARGVRVVVNGRSPDGVAATVAEIRDAGGEAVGSVGDLAGPEACNRVVDIAVEAFGGIDILVNNAGFLRTAPLVEMTDAQWQDVLDVQLTAQFRTSRRAAQQMIRQGGGGRIINMVGGGGFTGQYNNANHAASKGGGMGAVLTWSQELLKHHITVNGVVGIVETDMTRPLHDKVRAALKAQGKPHEISARDLGSYPPRESAAIVVWLASAAARLVTGQFFEIQGPMVQLWRMATIERSFHRFPAWTAESLEEAGLAQVAAGALRIEPSALPRVERMTAMHA
jgi:NAD(P)-dependent dehydrogenase (short-subunit alcohol dehydrogenase family)